eukprot:2423478-Prymnesium_polylepis.1
MVQGRLPSQLLLPGQRAGAAHAEPPPAARPPTEQALVEDPVHTPAADSRVRRGTRGSRVLERPDAAEATRPKKGAAEGAAE